MALEFPSVASLHPVFSPLKNDGHALGDCFRQAYWHGVSNLSHAFCPRTWKSKPVWKGLKPCAFTHCKIPNRAVFERKHVFASGNPMIASLESLRGKIQGT